MRFRPLLRRFCRPLERVSGGSTCRTISMNPGAMRPTRVALSLARTARPLLSRPQSTIKEAQVVKERIGRQQLAQEQEQERLERILQQALERYEHCIDEMPDHRPELQAALWEVRNAYEALEYWDQALVIERLWMDEYCDNELDRAAGLYRQGKLHMRMNELAPANRDYQAALALYQQELENSSHPDVGNLLISMAGVHFHRDRMEEALQVLQQAEPHFVLGDDFERRFHRDYVKCLQHQGLLYRSMQDFESALAKYQQALEVDERLDPEHRQSERRQGLLLDIADMLAAADRHEQALEAYQRVLDEYQSQNEAIEGVVLHAMGKIHAMASSDHERAIDELSRALEIKQRLVGESHPEVAKTLDALGAVYAVTGNRTAALECFQQSLLIARMYAGERGEQDPSVMLALRNIAVLKGEKVAKWGSEEEPTKP